MLQVEASTMVKAPRETVLEVDHLEGKVVNELVVRPPDTLELWEEKRRYDARFLNRFEPAPGGSRRRPAPAPPRGHAQGVSEGVRDALVMWV